MGHFRPISQHTHPKLALPVSDHEAADAVETMPKSVDDVPEFIFNINPGNSILS